MKRSFLSNSFKDKFVAEQEPGKETESEAEEDQAVGFTFRPDYQAPFSTVYSNFALVSHTGDDFAVDFCLIAPPYHAHTETKTVNIPVIARVIVPPGLAQGLIEALRIQVEMQTSERQAGQIIIPVKKPGPHSNA
jgi:hypothetical protein